MNLKTKDMMQYGKIGMGALKYGKKAHKWNRIKKRIPAFGKKAKIAAAKKKQRIEIWNKRKQTIKQIGKQTKKVAKGTGIISRWIWKRYL